MQENTDNLHEENTSTNHENTDNTSSTTPQATEADGNPTAQANLSSEEKLQAELAEQKDKYLRLMAEFENFKRRTAKERIELFQTAGKDIIVSLLDVLDDVERAETQLNKTEDMATQKEGITLVFNKFKAALQAKGLQAIDSINKDFDVEQHEAITEIPAPTPELSGKVIDQVQKGYLLNDKIIRFAKVVVGK